MVCSFGVALTSDGPELLGRWLDVDAFSSFFAVPDRKVRSFVFRR
jgi:hypothetical protein